MSAASCHGASPVVRITNNQRLPVLLLRVELYDELFLNRETDVFAFRNVRHGSEELFGTELEPRGDSASAGRFDGLADLLVLAALFTNLDRIALAYLVRGDVDLLAVHLDVSVADELASLCARRREPE